MICLFILMKPECILQKDTQEIKAMLLEKIKKNHMFIRQIPDKKICFCVKNKKFCYIKTIAIVKDLIPKPTLYERNILSLYSCNMAAFGQCEKGFSAISEFSQLLVNFGENPGVISKKQTGFIYSKTIFLKQVAPDDQHLQVALNEQHHQVAPNYQHHPFDINED
ncbi:hypothetical protein RFI_21809 [Reticulomyxa filosa]|uniref:Uncharacterized protein n=1 Tax=Reticulomyxa filosa TaxID=46433 RepID=X6MR23_RETFI|nr:hypothetical protein RFI_21809 [Reticulomyxa filosa]|eukprot:ETO15555.1 hypothetical protein RFI_21809 [Reticulomyxa filosa]